MFLFILFCSRSLQRLNTIAKVDGNGMSQPQAVFLAVPVVVYAGLIVSAGNCSIKNMNLNVNISIRDRELDGKELKSINGVYCNLFLL